MRDARRLLLLTGAAVAAAMAILALDAEYRGDAKAASFSGCYVGGVGSYNALVEDDGGDGAEGPAIAGTVGCDVQRGAFVLGALVEYGFGRLEFDGDDIDVQGWAAGTRAGYVVFDQALLYALLKWTDLQFSEDGYGDEDASGPVVGAGAEVALGGGFFGRLEYNYAMLEVDDGGEEANAHSGRVGLVYRFGVPQVDSFSKAPLK